MVTPDLPGSGDTADPGGPLELDDVAAQVAAAAAASGLDRYALVGFSLGAAVAAALAASQPDRVDALVMMAATETGADARSVLQFDLWRELSERDPALFARLWLLTGFSPAFVSRVPVSELHRAATFPVAPGIGRQCDLSARIDLRDRLGEIRAPTLVVGCSEDWITPPAWARALADGFAGATYTELDAGHMAVLEAPAAFTALVRDFLLGLRR